MGIMIYSGLFFYLGEAQVQCIHKSLSGVNCPSCGFSQAFANFVHLQFREGIQLNTLAFPVFLFLIVQLFMRSLIVGNLLNIQTWSKLRVLDLVISLLGAIWVFAPLLLANIKFYAGLK